MKPVPAVRLLPELHRGCDGARSDLCQCHRMDLDPKASYADPTVRAFGYNGHDGVYYSLMMSTGLTFGTGSALLGLNHGIIDQGQYSHLVATVIGSAVIAGVGKTRPASRIARRKWADFPPGTGTTGARKVKNSEAIENGAIMDARYEREPLGAAAGVCDRPDQSGAPPEERIPGGGESHFAGTPASSANAAMVTEAAD